MRTSTPAFRSPRAARLSPLAAGIAVALAPVPALATTYPVTNTAEFIAAINAANANCATDSAPLITAAGGPFVVSTSTGMPSFGLPTLFCATNAFNPVIDGGGLVSASDVDGFATTMEIRGTGSSADCGLTFPQNFTYGGHLTVTGMKISNFTYGSLSGGVCGAFEIHNNLLAGNSVGARSIDSGNILGDSSSGGNVVIGNDYGFWVSAAATIENNKIGTPNGSTASRNTYGIYVTSSNGPTIDNNLISGNTTGVYFSNDYGGTTLSDNYIGTTADGDASLPNGDGVIISSSGSQSLDNNVIAGNSGAGVSIEYTSFVTFDTNYIGVGFSGSPLPNNRGVDAFCSGYIDLFSNTISSNTADGILFQSVDGSQLSSNTIMSNRGNGARLLTNNASCFQYGSYNSFFGNDIESNGANGILLTGLGTNNRFSYGTITGNAGKNISLNGGGAPLPNDGGDGDGGPNNQQNYPDIANVVQGAGFTSIDFSVDSSAASQYQVDFYSNSAMGKPAGETYLGSAFVYGATPSTYVYYGGAVNNVSATATLPYCCGPGGDTSEFSPMKAAITAPTVLISPSSWNFGNVQVGQSSPTKNFTLGSIGDQPYVISDIQPGSFCLGDQPKAIAAAAVPSFCYGGGFTCSTTCDLNTPYSKNQTCTFTAQFAPFFFGLQQDSICIFDNTSASPHFINLSGTGVPPPPLVIDPSTFDFGDVPVGATSDSMRFRVTNNTYGSMPVTVATTGGEFNVVSDTCSPTIPSLSNCDVLVDFGPSVSGGQDGTLIVQGALLGDAPQKGAILIAGPPTATARLGGNGISGGQLVLPDSIDMGAAQVGGTAISYALQLVNTGYGTITLSSITASSPFELSNGCPATLAPQQACTITLLFAATALGEVQGTLTVVSSAEGGSRAIPVTARGQTVTSPLIRLQPSALGFGARVIGSSSGAQEIKVTNIGGATANIVLNSATIDFLVSSSTCGATLAPQDSCSANVSFRPLGFGTRLGQFVVTGNATNSPATANLSGTGCRPFAAGSSRFGSSLSCAP